MSYYHRAAGRMQTSMLLYAKQNFDDYTYKQLLKSNKKVLLAMYIYIFILFILLFTTIFCLNVLSINTIIVLVIIACLSPIIYFVLYFNTFGKDWNKYVKWYKNSNKKGEYIFEEKVKLNENMIIKRIRGGMYDCVITFESGPKLKCKGILAMPGTEKFYIHEVCQKLSDREKEIFIKILNNYKEKNNDSFVELSSKFY